ncbi:MAG: 1,4-dihydroxy-6-naphthoate synthase [Saprospiraceae bacterium]|nr:1,4-dihydroxy-6-naphthoate synthase [Saprospiraceae bacterium]
MKLTLGFSPCPNDTFMMEALVHRKVDADELEFDVRIADVETLNEWALEGQLDVTKVSFHAYLKIMQEYSLLSSGAALGFGCGPLLIARQPLSEDVINQGPVAIPGTHTTAHMLFRLRYPAAQRKQFMVFSDIEDAVVNGSAVAGVIIHENRFTYQDKGLHCIEDLGTFWERETGTPIPLGAFVARTTLGAGQIRRIETLIRQSIQHAFAQPESTMPYVRAHAQEMDQQVMQQHINTYVNTFSLDLGSEGLKAVQRLQARAYQAGLMR